MRIVPQKTQTGACQRQAGNGQFSRQRNERKLQVTDKGGVSDNLGQQTESQSDKGDQTRGQSVQTVGKVDGV